MTSVRDADYSAMWSESFSGSALAIWHQGTLNLDFPLQISIATSHRCLRATLNQPVLLGFPLLAIPFAESASGRCASREMPEYTWRSGRPPKVGPRRCRTQPNQTGGVEMET